MRCRSKSYIAGGSRVRIWSNYRNIVMNFRSQEQGWVLNLILLRLLTKLKHLYQVQIHIKSIGAKSLHLFVINVPVIDCIVTVIYIFMQSSTISFFILVQLTRLREVHRLVSSCPQVFEQLPPLKQRQCYTTFGDLCWVLVPNSWYRCRYHFKCEEYQKIFLIFLVQY